MRTALLFFMPGAQRDKHSNTCPLHGLAKHLEPTAHGLGQLTCYGCAQPHTSKSAIDGSISLGKWLMIHPQGHYHCHHADIRADKQDTNDVLHERPMHLNLSPKNIKADLTFICTTCCIHYMR